MCNTGPTKTYVVNTGVREGYTFRDNTMAKRKEKERTNNYMIINDGFS
jgi:hypothetical protein